METIRRKPQVDDLCTVLFEGSERKAKVTKVNNDTFDVMMSFGEPMYNISFDYFKYYPSIGEQIVGLLNKEYELNLYGVDMFDMSSDVNDLIEKNLWALNKPH